MGDRSDALLLVLAPANRQQGCGAVRGAVGARTRLDHATDDGRPAGGVEALAEMQGMAWRRVGQPEPRPVDAHRAVVDREHAQPLGEPMRILDARHDEDVREPAELAGGERWIARIGRVDAVLLLDGAEEHDRETATGIEEARLDEGVDLLAPHDRLRCRAQSLGSGGRALADEVVEQRNQRRSQWRRRHTKVTQILLHRYPDIDHVTGAHRHRRWSARAATDPIHPRVAR